MYYFLGVSLCWLLCYGLYRVFLHRESFFQLNRLYLLGTLALGLLLPLLDWPRAVPPVAAAPDIYRLPAVVIDAGVAAPPAETGYWSWTEVLWFVYLTGCSFMLIRLLLRSWNLFSMIRRGERQPRGDLIWVGVSGLASPASFFHYFFHEKDWNPDTPEARAVLAHERAHARQGHSLDLLFSELIGLFFWWCPLWYAYDRALRLTHEYLADAAALRRLTVRDYGQLLLGQHLRGAPVPLVHTFNFSPIKLRITMMTRNRSSRMALARYLLLLPAVALAFWACNELDSNDETTKMLVEHEAVVSVDTLISFDPETYKKSVEIIENIYYRTADQMPVFGDCEGLVGDERIRCSEQNVQAYLRSKLADIKLPDAGSFSRDTIFVVDPETMEQSVTVIENTPVPFDQLEGQVEVSFQILENGKPDWVVIRKSLHREVDRLVGQAIREMPAWQPGLIDGEPVTVRMSLPVAFELD